PGGKQIWRWVIGTPLLFYAFHNWDLWAMVPAVIGIYAYSKNRDALAGSTLAVGASAKLFPGLFLPPFIIMRWFSGDRRGAIRLTLWAGIVTVLLNGPIAIASPTGWAYPVKFQGARSASWGTVWEWFDRIPGIKSLVSTDPAAIANKVSILVLGLGLIAITVLAVRRNLSAVAVAAAATALFLLSNKIYSPTYDLWMVPFFVLLAIPRRVWLAYCAADIGVFVLVFGRFHGFWEAQAVVNSLWLFVFLRAATLVFVIFIALRSTAPSSPDLGTMWDHVRTPAGGPNR
ncbi:MAG TPA: hypothetical protein VL068_13010, partial [Microthrixaceae bacterium]|nr:hypothetical protein [Microthrixaceae bacterium]